MDKAVAKQQTTKSPKLSHGQYSALSQGHSSHKPTPDVQSAAILY